MAGIWNVATRIGLLALGVIGILALPTGAAAATTETFSTPGSHTFTPSPVPGVVTFEVNGAAGGTFSISSPLSVFNPGGNGGALEATVPVGAATTYSIEVGSRGVTPGPGSPGGAPGGTFTFPGLGC